MPKIIQMELSKTVKRNLNDCSLENTEITPDAWHIVGAH